MPRSHKYLSSETAGLLASASVIISSIRIKSGRENPLLVPRTTDPPGAAAINVILRPLKVKVFSSMLSLDVSASQRPNNARMLSVSRIDITSAIISAAFFVILPISRKYFFLLNISSQAITNLTQVVFACARGIPIANLLKSLVFTVPSTIFQNTPI